MPFVLSVVITGSPGQTYGLLQISNWAWTLTEAASSGFDPAIATVLIVIGLVITAVNLFLFLRALRYHRITVPDRVKQDQGTV
jgi:hypothetical protein